MGTLIATPGRPRGLALPRVIPTLLLDRDGRLVKTVRFKKRTYIGDPINAVRIFNTKEVDELVLLDIDATADGRDPHYGRIEEIAAEAFMPLAYGGGIRSVDQIERLYEVGVEKVILSSVIESGLSVIRAAAQRWGTQAVTACLPVARGWRGGLQVRLRNGRARVRVSLPTLIRELADAGAGEIIVYSIHRDGTWAGYDTEALTEASKATNLPVVACGGAGSFADLNLATREGGAAAVAVGSMFVYQAKGRGVLISYPSPADLLEIFCQQPSF